MRTITLWQPWASLIVTDMKKVETRGHKTNIRGRVAIHAAKFRKIPHEVFREIYDLLPPYSMVATWLGSIEKGKCTENFGSVLGTVVIKDCVPIEELYGTEYDTPLERAVGDWSVGRYGWILSAPQTFESSVPVKGKQGFWNWEDK